jgi:hypothetical protein
MLVSVCVFLQFNCNSTLLKLCLLAQYFTLLLQPVACTDIGCNGQKVVAI